MALCQAEVEAGHGARHLLMTEQFPLFSAFSGMIKRKRMAFCPPKCVFSPPALRARRRRRRPGHAAAGAASAARGAVMVCVGRRVRGGDGWGWGEGA